MTEKELVDTMVDTSRSTRERGDALETLVKQTIEERSPFCNVRKTKASGSLHGDGDLRILDIVTDCKVKGECKNVNVTASELRKVEEQGAKTDSRGAIIVPTIRDGKINLYAVIRLEELIYMSIHGERSTE